MQLIVLRHASAGSRSRWDGADELRPLDELGRAQAISLAGRLAGDAPRRLVASPYLRCVQTLEPLAHALGAVVETDPRLAEGASGRRAFAVLCEAEPGGVVVCTHGDVVQELLGEALPKGGGAVVTLDGPWARPVERIAPD